MRADRLVAAPLLMQARGVRPVYERRAGERTQRLADPWGLVDKDGIWYVAAGTERGQRTFRGDRIVSATVTDLPLERPEGFEPARAWERVVAEMEQRRSQTSATVLVAERFAPILRDHFGRHCEGEESSPGGRARRRSGPSRPGSAPISSSATANDLARVRA
ncbi:WYL domain-containing protein [Nonomuraea sp. B10E15]|uniref:helix-turn-helix transcriptional regulator n=1 Tax=Nonomuraea sp. B10E15 TaxID=3153560 RepID=UPI00325E927E